MVFKVIALVDCNNFYVSCERVFNPRLENRPVVVLSNNDGCIISRSNEAKKLKIPMGAPFYQWEPFCRKHSVSVFSSNYELYGDMSARVMSILKNFNTAMEIYSIDEAFLFFDKKISLQELVKLRQEIKKNTGIPISIGVGQTKTLAKISNQLAKNFVKSGIWIFKKEPQMLDNFPVAKIWGIGPNTAKKLNSLKIKTAAQLRESDPKMIRHHFNVNIEKTIQELNGISCLGLEKNQPRKQIISSRSFGKPITELSDLEEAVSHYTTIAARKLRKQKSAASALYVFLQTNMFNNYLSQYSNEIMFPFPIPSSDTRYFIHIAKKCLRHIYKKEFKYHKAGIMLLDIRSVNTKQYDLITPIENQKGDDLMSTLDNINTRFGKNTLFVAAEGIQRKWLIRCDKRSSRYTTRWEELLKVMCK